MDSQNEEVKYSYTGDVSSLRSATQQAIGLLGKYETTVKSLVTSNKFNVGKTAFTGFQRNINGLIKQTNVLSGFFSKASTEAQAALGFDKGNMASVVRDIADALQYMDGEATITTEDIKLINSVLKDTRAVLEPVATRAKVLGSSFAEVKNIVEQTTTEVVENEKQWEHINFTAIQNAAFREYAAKVDQNLGHVEKSARESAQAMVNEFAKTSPVVTKLVSMSDGLLKLKESMHTMVNSTSGKFSGFFDPIIAKMQAFKDQASMHMTAAAEAARTVAAAFRRLAPAASSADDSVEDEAESAEESAKAHTKLRYSLGSLIGVFRQSIQGLRKFTNSMDRAHGSSRLLHRALAGITGISVAKWFSNATKQSIRYVETLNLFTVATGDAYAESRKFIDQMAEFYGMDPSNLLRYAGNFYQLADAISMPDKAAANLSLGLTKATNDIASLFNVDVETVFKDLSSGMMGMTRAVRKYGMDLRTITLQQTAFTLGITEKVNQMSEANRQGLRFITMMRQAANASGDFAKTIEEPANQLRIFREQMSQLGRAIGDLFIRPLTIAVQHINGFVMALRMMITYIGTLLGVVRKEVGGATNTTDKVADSIEGIGNSASEAAKDLKKFIAPFDELNVMQSQKGDKGSIDAEDVGALDPAIEEEISKMQWQLEAVRMKAHEVRDAILKFFGFKVDMGEIISWDSATFEANLINKFPKWTKTIRATFRNWTRIVKGFKSVFKSLGEVAQSTWDKVTGFLSKHINDQTMSDFVNNLADNLEKLASWISTNSESISNLVLAFSSLALLTPVLTIVSGLCQGLMWLIGLAQQVGPAVAGAGGAISAASLSIAAVVASVGVALVDLVLTDQDTKNALVKDWKALSKLISTIWNSLLKPILKRIGESISNLYNEVIKPVVKKIVQILSILWSDILAPILTWVVQVLGPVISRVIDLILNAVDSAVKTLGRFITGILTSLKGLLDFLVGVFTGDWHRAWVGILNIVIGVLNAVIAVASAILNTAISILNGVIKALWDGIVGWINGLLSHIDAIAGYIGKSFEYRITAEAPQIPTINYQIPEVPLATGAVVTGPTHALIGEGRYDEAVIPLGNSPQMNEFADSVASRLNTAEQVELLQEQNELLRQILNKTGKINLDGKVLSDTVSEYQRRRARATGGRV